MSDNTCNHCGCSKERCWIDFPEDQNCIYVSISKHGAMTLDELSKVVGRLDEVSKRLGISLVRVSQIEKEAMKKLSKRIKL